MSPPGARVPGLATFSAADRKAEAIDGDGRLRRRLVRAVGRCRSRQLIDTVKAHRERLRWHFRREVKGHKDSIFVMIVFVPRRLVPVGPKPFAYCGHRSRKLSGAYPDRDATHPTSPPSGRLFIWSDAADAEHRDEPSFRLSGGARARAALPG